MASKVYTIDEIKEKITPIAKQYGIERAYLFGSYARGEATINSDIDILIDKGRIDDLLELGGFIMDLEDIFSLHVDVVTTDISNQIFLSNIRNNEVNIYG